MGLPFSHTAVRHVHLAFPKRLLAHTAILGCEGNGRRWDIDHVAISLTSRRSRTISDPGTELVHAALTVQGRKVIMIHSMVVHARPSRLIARITSDLPVVSLL
jgi:hypothetical protein